MMDRAHDTIIFNIPASFILPRMLPTASEVGYGVRHGWLGPPDVTEVVAARRAAGVRISASEEALARMSSASKAELGNSLRELEKRPDASSSDRAWLFLALAWLLEHRSTFDEPFQAIERLYADFGFPREMESIVRFMPVAPGEPRGLEVIEKRWRGIVDAFAREFSDRRPS